MRKVLITWIALMMLTSLVACSNSTPKPSETSDPETTYQAGSYTGVSTGHNGEVKVSVTFGDEAIEKVEVLEQSETPAIAEKALSDIPNDIVTYQSLGVETVSGATFTSLAVINAVGDAVGQAGGDASTLKKVECDYPTLATEDLNCDILIIGGGTSGLMAALTAVEAGKKVIVVEKEDIFGGTLNVAAGLLLTVNSESNDATIDDSLERVIKFYKNVNTDSVHQPDYDFTSNLMSQTGKTVDQLIALGFDHIDLDMGNYAGTIFTLGSTLSLDLQEVLASKGVTMLSGTAGKSLVAEEGIVKGAVVENRSGEYTINASKVIVTAGGASYSADLKSSEASLATVDLNEKTAIGSTADGMHMLATVGGSMSDDIYVKSSQPDFAQVFGTNWSNTPSTATTFMIDSEGKRFASEAQAADTVLNKKMIDHASSSYWNIMDANNAIGMDTDFMSKVAEFSKDDNVKVAVYADTIEELAAKIGVDAATLQATFDTYQEACVTGKDAEFHKDASSLIPYSTEGGYYAVYRRIGSWGTIGGIHVDENQRVLDEAGTPIANVYAAGETATSEIFGDYYFGGFSLGLYTTAGRIAAETAISEME